MAPDPTQGPPLETVVSLPDPWAAWPWTRRLNPFHARARADSAAWIRSYELYTGSPDAQKAFDLCDFGLLGSLAYPDSTEGELRMICDFLQLVFAFDDCMESTDELSARNMASALVGGLTDGDMPELDSENDGVWGAIARDFWKRLVLVMPNPSHQRRFQADIESYANAVVQEVQDQHRGHIRDIPDFFELRRRTSGTYPCWVLLYMGLGIPDVVFDDPAVQELEQVAADMVIICNDVVSYKPESSRGEHHNVIAVLRARYGFSIQDAMEWAGNKGSELMTAAEHLKLRLPAFGSSVNRDLELYAEGLCNWVRACDSWSFEGQRYFGEDAAAVRMSRQLVLRAG